MYHQTDLICIDLSSFISCSSVLHEEYLQSHLFAEPHHHVCDPAAPHLLHGSHEHHPGVPDRRRPQQRCVLLLAQMVMIERLLYMFNIRPQTHGGSRGWRLLLTMYIFSLCSLTPNIPLSTTPSCCLLLTQLCLSLIVCLSCSSSFPLTLASCCSCSGDNASG